MCVGRGDWYKATRNNLMQKAKKFGGFNPLPNIPAKNPERMIEDSKKEGKKAKTKEGQEKGGFRADKADEEDRRREENHLLMLS